MVFLEKSRSCFTCSFGVFGRSRFFPRWAREAERTEIKQQIFFVLCWNDRFLENSATPKSDAVFTALSERIKKRKGKGGERKGWGQEARLGLLQIIFQNHRDAGVEIYVALFLQHYQKEWKRKRGRGERRKGGELDFRIMIFWSFWCLGILSGVSALQLACFATALVWEISVNVLLLQRCCNLALIIRGCCVQAHSVTCCSVCDLPFSSLCVFSSTMLVTPRRRSTLPLHAAVSIYCSHCKGANENPYKMGWNHWGTNE